ncbi:MAG: riboflavin biosynthesis protein RibF [Verrucomicrobia bacterium]|nr:riboflavin biosynthesis protein RibF [Verrucomicrobiota bacterium]
MRWPHGRAGPYPLRKFRAFQSGPLVRPRNCAGNRLSRPPPDFAPGNLPHPPHVTVLDSLAPLPSGTSVRHLALGFFDGLHLGHRRVILGGEKPHAPALTAVLTFRDHPLSVLHPEKHPALITGLPHKLRVLERWQIGMTVALPFDANRSRQEPADFLKELASAFPSLQTVSVGPNWRFGKDRSGDVDLLGRWCAERKIHLDNPDPVVFAGGRISSSRIRAAIAAGQLTDTAEMLGRPFTLFGTVGTGAGRGAGLGFATANLQTEDECLPPDGVYAGRAFLDDGKTFPAAINLGSQPTFGGQERHPEAHLIGFAGELSGQKLDLEFSKFLRPIQKFESAKALAAQIQKDVAVVVKSSP